MVIDKIYCDMDGVLCNFKKGFKNLTGGLDIEQYAAKYHWGAVWKLITKAGPEYWSELEWNEGGERLWSFLRDISEYEGIELEILTGSPYAKAGEYAKTGKELWCKNNLGNVIVNHKRGSKKQEYIAKNTGDGKVILVDDMVRNCKLWEDHGGISILHDVSGRKVDETIKKLKQIIL